MAGKLVLKKHEILLSEGGTKKISLKEGLPQKAQDMYEYVLTNMERVIILYNAYKKVDKKSVDISFYVSTYIYPDSITYSVQENRIVVSYDFFNDGGYQEAIEWKWKRERKKNIVVDK